MKTKKIIACLLLTTILFTMTGCGTQVEETADTEEVMVNIEQNSWSGGVGRVIKLQNQVMDTINVIEEYNNYIVKNNPTDYWSDAYFYIGIVPINSTWLPWTYYMCEDIDEATMLSYTTNAFPDIFSSPAITRSPEITKVEKNHYILTWETNEKHPVLGIEAYIVTTIDCTYDAMHNRLRGTYTITDRFGDSQYLQGMYEYAEIDAHTFAVQTDTDRLFVRLNDDGTIKQMYYSVLSPTQNRAGYEEDDVDIDVWYKTWWVDWEVAVEEANEEVYYKYPNRYNYVDDSIFSNPEELSPDWVMEEPTVGQYIIYDNGTLTALMQNILTGDMEGFSLKRNVTSSLPEGVTEGGASGNTDTMAVPTSEPAQSTESDTETVQEGTETTEEQANEAGETEETTSE